MGSIWFDHARILLQCNEFMQKMRKQARKPPRQAGCNMAARWMLFATTDRPPRLVVARLPLTPTPPFRRLKMHRQPCGARSLPPLGRLCPLRRGLLPRHLAGDRHRSPLRTFRLRYPAPTGNPERIPHMPSRLLLLRHPSASAPALASDPTAQQSHLFRWMNFATRFPVCSGCRPTSAGSGRSGNFEESPSTICTSCGGSCTRRRICS